MENEVLEKLRCTQIEILDEIDKICKENDIKYFLMFGSLLGAIRHNGFIPWDDDIDIGMIRDDYEKFIKIAPKVLKSNFILDHISTNSKYYLPFIKIRNKNTCFDEPSTVYYKGSKGIWVDIFPYDNICSEQKNYMFILKNKVLNLLYACLVNKSLKCSHYSFKVNIISKLLPYRLIHKMIYNLSSNKNEYSYLVYYQIAGYKVIPIFKKTDIFPLKEHIFQNKKYYIPNNSDLILKKLFGKNYMDLPPVEMRITHKPLRIVFDDGEVIDFSNAE